MYIKRLSPITGFEITRNIPVNIDDYLAWESGLGSIEELMPYLTSEDAQFILGGVTEKDWDEAFSDLEEID